MIYILIGPPGSGKTTILQHLEAQGWAGFEASDYIKKAMARFGVTNLADLPSKAGSGIAARMIGEELATLPAACPVVISGFRASSEIAHIKALRPDTVVVGLYLNAPTAYARISQRLRSGDELSQAEFKARVESDLNLGVANILYDQADAYIATNRAIDDIITDIAQLTPASVPENKWHVTAPELEHPDRIIIAGIPRI